MATLKNLKSPAPDWMRAIRDIATTTASAIVIPLKAFNCTDGTILQVTASLGFIATMAALGCRNSSNGKVVVNPDEVKESVG